MVYLQILKPHIQKLNLRYLNLSVWLPLVKAKQQHVHGDKLVMSLSQRSFVSGMRKGELFLEIFFTCKISHNDIRTCILFCLLHNMLHNMAQRKKKCSFFCICGTTIVLKSSKFDLLQPCNYRALFILTQNFLFLKKKHVQLYFNIFSATWTFLYRLYLLFWLLSCPTMLLH